MPVNWSTVSAADTPCFHPSRNLRFFDRIYAIHHARRFEWLKSKIACLGKSDISVLELGCNDARSVEYIPVPIRRYLGLDAGWRSGWENGKAYGLESAQARFRDRPHFELRRSERCEDLERVPGKFDVAIVLETFEYLDPSKLEAYVSVLSEKLIDGGAILATMPNEKGMPLLVKALGSRLSGVPRSGYTPAQFWNALIGRLDRVPRATRGRRGFDYQKMSEIIWRYLPHGYLESVEPANAPLWLSLNVGLVARKATAQPLASEVQAERGFPRGVICK